MMLARVLEPEVMSGADEAVEYDAMDFTATDRLFAERGAYLASLCEDHVGWIVDLGSGNGKIPLAMCALLPKTSVCAVEMSVEMLALAARNRAKAKVSPRHFQLVVCDAKRTPFAASSLGMITSNSLIHHLADPRAVLREVARVVRPKAPILIRDLIRPESEEQLVHLVNTYAGESSSLQRTLFADSLRAALTVGEVRQALDESGLKDVQVSQVSDRHWSAERAPHHAAGG